MSALAYTVSRLDARCCAATSGACVRYPSLTLLLVGMPIVFLLLFVYVFGGQLGARPRHARRRTDRPGRLPQLRHARHPADDRCRRRPGHRDRRRDGHDRRHHRSIPHHGHRPRRRAHRPRARQPDPEPRSASPSCSASPIALGFRPNANADRMAGRDRRARRCSRWRWSGCRPHSASRPRASRPPATRRCSSRSCPSSAAASSPPPLCRPACGSSRRTSRSRPTTETVRGLLTGTPIGTPTPSRQSPGASASPSPPTSGRDTSTTTAPPTEPPRAAPAHVGRGGVALSSSIPARRGTIRR